MTRQSTIENRLGRIEQALERGKEDREETNRKIDGLDAKFDAVLATNGETAGAVRQLAQSVESSTRTMERLSNENCGARIKSIEEWMPKLESRLASLEQPRELRRLDEQRLQDCERGVKDYRDTKAAWRRAVWQIILAVVGSGTAGGGIGAVIGHFVWHH